MQRPSPSGVQKTQVSDHIIHGRLSAYMAGPALHTTKLGVSTMNTCTLAAGAGQCSSTCGRACWRKWGAGNVDTGMLGGRRCGKKEKT
jgi:hypothetical protein